jgi:hypothetical protein
LAEVKKSNQCRQSQKIFVWESNIVACCALVIPESLAAGEDCAIEGPVTESRILEILQKYP